MKRRKWDPKTKALIIFQGLKGKQVSELCSEHEISQAQYYQWRDQFLTNAAKTFETSHQYQREKNLERENAKLKHVVGELTFELKKNDEIF